MVFKVEICSVEFYSDWRTEGKCSRCTYWLPALNVNAGPSSSAFLMKKSAMFLKPRRKGRDPTNGRDGKEGGQRCFISFLWLFHHPRTKLENIHVPRKTSISTVENILFLTRILVKDFSLRSLEITIMEEHRKNSIRKKRLTIRTSLTILKLMSIYFISERSFYRHFISDTHNEPHLSVWTLD